MHPQDRSDTGLPGEPYLHRDAADLLDLINRPELLETQTLGDIQHTFESSGYTQRPGGEVTIGWGRKVGEEEAYTSAMIVTEDRKLTTVGMGSEGAYYTHVYVHDVERPTEPELENLQSSLSCCDWPTAAMQDGGIGIGTAMRMSPLSVAVCRTLCPGEVEDLQRQFKDRAGEITEGE